MDHDVDVTIIESYDGPMIIVYYKRFRKTFRWIGWDSLSPFKYSREETNDYILSLIDIMADALKEGRE